MNNNAVPLSAARAACAGTASRRITIPATIALAAIGLAATSGCSTSSRAATGPPATASAAATVAALTTSPPATAPTTAPTPLPPAPPVPAGPLPCPTRYIAAKPGIVQGTPTVTYQVIDFTNIGNVTCTLYGYPGVSLAGGMPVGQIGLAAAEDPATPRALVTLAPGSVANALLRINHTASYPAWKCHPATAAYLVIYPPNKTTPIPVAYTSPTCAKPIQILTVDAVRPGSGG
jgi:Protein of unknown function (DUF4232)